MNPADVPPSARQPTGFPSTSKVVGGCNNVWLTIPATDKHVSANPLDGHGHVTPEKVSPETTDSPPYPLWYPPQEYGNTYNAARNPSRLDMLPFAPAMTEPMTECQCSHHQQPLVPTHAHGALMAPPQNEWTSRRPLAGGQLECPTGHTYRFGAMAPPVPTHARPIVVFVVCWLQRVVLLLRKVLI